LPKKLTNIGKNAFSWIKTQLIVGNYDTLPDVNVDSEAFADVTNITAEPSGYPKGYVMNIGSVSNSAFYDWLKSKGLPEYYFILPDVK
jgi:hypothetical protein